MAVARILIALLWAVSASCHFSVTHPATIAPVDDKSISKDPCGGADVTARTNVVEWPVVGGPLGFLSTHPDSMFHIGAALVNDTKTWKGLVPGLTQGGKVGYACLPAVQGIAAWVDEPAVVQIHQMSADGSLFQCMAVKFTTGSAAPMPKDHHACMNTTGLSLAFETSSTNGANATSNGTMPSHSHASSPSPSPTGAADQLRVWSRSGAWAVGAVVVALLL